MRALIKRVLRFLSTAVFLTLMGNAAASAQCQLPEFRTGQDYGTSVFISLKPRDFTLDKLACLSQALRNQRSEYQNFGVYFFDSEEAAKNFRLAVEGHPPRWPEWANELHAMFFFEAGKEDSLEIFPLGYNRAPSLVTTVDLPLTGVTHCRLEVENRCLIVGMEMTMHQQQLLNTTASGEIVLAGLIGRDGGVTGLRLAEADVHPRQGKALLVNAALQDLKTWQFDAARHEDPIRVIYSFAINASLPHGSLLEVRWVAPNEVRVGLNPPE